MQGMDYENVKYEYCMRGKHVAIICAVVVVAALAVGLGVGLSKSESSKAPEELPSTPKPTSGPEPPVDRGPCTPSNRAGVWNNFRLPDYVIPVHYDLELVPNLNNDIYTGSTTISINIKQATKHLWLHIRETFVTAIPKLQMKSGNSQQDVAVFRCFEYKAQEYVVVELKESLQPTANDEHYLLTLEFQGRLDGPLVGFYKTTYMEKGVLKLSVITRLGYNGLTACPPIPYTSDSYNISTVNTWFRNIVTMDWWDDLWLNEGFASFFEYMGVNKAEPDWKMLDVMVIDDVFPVMRDDALLSSHPIIVDVSTPAEITSVFDGISYSKGASVLRMLQDWISPEHFQTGCQNYLKDFHFKNAKTDNFWESLAKVSRKPVKEVMDT
ncbi:UNVERIFIED_CONTAM: hypothetical protein FKN15_074914 [Acipenser sinensis]